MIKCPECGKDVSDKATACPNCGCPIKKETEVSEKYLCCPHCGSRNLHVGKKGFSTGKAVAGVVLTGGIGILAGTIGSRETVVTCLDCGKKMKSGELKTTYTGDYQVELLDKIKDLLLHGDVNSIDESRKLFLSQPGVTLKDYTTFTDNFLEEVHSNDELKAKARKYAEEAKAKGTQDGCASVIALFIMLSSIPFFL